MRYGFMLLSSATCCLLAFVAAYAVRRTSVGTASKFLVEKILCNGLILASVLLAVLFVVKACCRN